jgi:hypothetical protein
MKFFAVGLGLALMFVPMTRALAANEPDGQNNDGQHEGRGGGVDHNGNEPDGNNNDGRFQFPK